MADEKDSLIAALKAQVESQEARIEALEGLVAAIPDNTGQAITTTKAKTIELSGEKFTVEGKQYQAVYPKWKSETGTVTEEMLLEDKKLQKELVSSGSKLVKLCGVLLMLLFAFAFSANATSVTINPYNVEHITPTKRELHPLQDMLIIFRNSNDAFEVQTAQTRSKIWGGDIDSVTIAGASTKAEKLAYLRTLMLESTTTGGFRCFIGRNNLEFNYNPATSRLDVKNSINKQPLWFGRIDSLQSGPSGATNKMAYLRLVNRWQSELALPSASAATIAAGAAAGASPTVTVTGDGYSGSVSITTGASGATTGTLATVTLNIKAPTGTRVVVSPTNDIALLHNVRVRWTGTATTIVATVPATALSAASAYTYDYKVVPF